jgi:hypothetical protein
MVLLEGKVVWENLRTAFVSIDELLLFLKRHEFNGYCQITFSDCACVLFLHEGDVINGLQDGRQERLCGQPAVRNTIDRSHVDKNGSIAVKQLPPSTAELLARVYGPKFKLMYSESDSGSGQFVGFVSQLKREAFTGYVELWFPARKTRGIIGFNEGKVKIILTKELQADLRQESEAELKFIQSFIEKAHKTGVAYTAYGQY